MQIKSDSTWISQHPESISITVVGAALKSRNRGHTLSKGGSEPTVPQGRAPRMGEKGSGTQNPQAGWIFLMVFLYITATWSLSFQCGKQQGAGGDDAHDHTGHPSAASVSPRDDMEERPPHSYCSLLLLCMGW